MFGIDFSKIRLKIVRDNFGKKQNLSWVIFMKNYPIQIVFFDAIVSIRVIYHQKLAKIRKLIKEIKRI